MYEVILVPLDGSHRAEKILPYVENFAAEKKSKVILLQVIEPVSPVITPPDMMPYYNSELVDAVAQEAHDYMAGKAGEFRAKGFEVEAIVAQGPVVRTILEIAEQKSAGIIAMASHGRTGMSAVFHGSVAVGILHGADRPLLLIRSLDTA